MGTVLKVKLSAESLAKAATEVERYRKSLEEKCSIFRRKLIEKGIDTAKSNCGEYAGMIVFECEDGKDSSFLVATDGSKAKRRWMYKGKVKEVEVSPLLMAEFGSGWLADVLFDVGGVGQGTFPEQRHAFDPQGWWWTTPDGVKHHSEGEAPTHPMYAATMAMLFEADRIAKEVFQTNEVIQC